MPIDIRSLLTRSDLPVWLMAHKVPAEDREWEDDMKGHTIRLPGRITRVIEMLRDDPQSPYYKQWATKSDFLRDMIVFGTVKIMEGFSKTRSEASEWALSEDVLSGIASRKLRTTKAHEIVGMLLKSVLGALSSGHEKEGIEQWEQFIDQLDKGPKDQRDLYGEVMVKSHWFEDLDLVVLKSKIIQDFVEEFI